MASTASSYLSDGTSICIGVPFGFWYLKLMHLLHRDCGNTGNHPQHLELALDGVGHEVTLGNQDNAMSVLLATQHYKRILILTTNIFIATILPSVSAAPGSLLARIGKAEPADARRQARI